jgi:hypothetical protein
MRNSYPLLKMVIKQKRNRLKGTQATFLTHHQFRTGHHHVMNSPNKPSGRGI